MNRRLSGLVVSLLMLACDPIGPCPGGRLVGDTGIVEPDWMHIRDIETAQLETRPSDPHSVNTWFVNENAILYVPTSMIRGPRSPRERSWVEHVSSDPTVRIRLGELVLERTATRVSDPAEYERVRAALEMKYGLDPARRDPERDVWIYRLDERNDRSR